MDTAIINIRINPLLKQQAHQVADELGFSLSGLVNAYLKQLIRTKTITFSSSSEKPTAYLLNMLKESKKNISRGEVSPTFSKAKDAIVWLNK